MEKLQHLLTEPKLKFYFIRFIIFLCILLLPIDLFILYNLTFFKKIYPNVYVNHRLVGGKSKEETASLILQDLGSRSTSLTLAVNSHTYTLNESDIALQYDVDATVSKAYAIGRDSDLLHNLLTRLTILKDQQYLPLSVIVSEEKLHSYLTSLSAEYEEPMIPPTITIEGKAGKKIVTVSQGKTGKKIDLSDAKNQIRQAYATQNTSPITLSVISVSPNVTDEMTIKTQELASKLLDKTLILEQGELTWKLTDEELINFLSVYDTFDTQKLSIWVEQLAATVNREPENALLQFEGQLVTEFKPAKAGVSLNKEKTLEEIKNGVLQLANEQNSYTIKLVTSTKEPDISTDRVNSLGIKELIGKGESWFPHSIAGRIHNVDLAASKFHGVLIPPGETFSFVKTVGEIDAQHGYQPAYIIQNGRTILGDGGGVCQVSTTLFRAALDAGLEIVERHAHAYRVSYYEVNSSPGIDATIFSPSVDLKFVNDTPAHILIQATVDKKNTYMKFELYGTNDGRKVTMTKPQIWEQMPPPPDVYQDDPTLPKGVVKQVDWKSWGAKTSFTWTVVRDNQTLHEKTFYSTYRPWAAVFLRGTKEN